MGGENDSNNKSLNIEHRNSHININKQQQEQPKPQQQRHRYSHHLKRQMTIVTAICVTLSRKLSMQPEIKVTLWEQLSTEQVLSQVSRYSPSFMPILKPSQISDQVPSQTLGLLPAPSLVQSLSKTKVQAKSQRI